MENILINHVAKCSCGAITVTDDKENYSMSIETFEKIRPQLYISFDAAEFGKYENCNHCVNHWGIDLCACGSGETPEKCDNELSMCGTPFQTLGKIQPGIIEIIGKRGFV